MVTVAHIVAKLIREEPIIEDALAKDLFNYSKLAAYFHPKVEKEMGKQVKLSAIVMAIARGSEKIRNEYEGRISRKTFAQAELSVRSGIAEITIQKSPSCFEELTKLYRIVDLSGGDVLNINIGGSEVSVIFTERYFDEFKKALSDEKIKMELRSLSEIAIRFPKDYLYEPGFIYTITRHFAWYGINIVEMVSTLSELILVIKGEDATLAYSALQELFTQKKGKKE
ncbi:Uncharacterised protein [uncultured archaeon]|nr:Uncharacterised protein [uncultured archaeon]